MARDGGKSQCVVRGSEGKSQCGVRGAEMPGTSSQEPGENLKLSNHGRRLGFDFSDH